MKIIRGIAAFVPPARPVALTLGFFDGVHIGHRLLLERLASIARDKDAVPVVLTFDSHPYRTVKPEQLPPMIMTLTERLSLMDDLGIETAIVQPFDEQLCAVSANDFLHDILLSKLRASVIVCGYDTQFGQRREGNHAFLKAHAPHDGFELHDVPPCKVNGETVSSTAIRSAIMQGSFSHAATLLGRPWSIWAQVVQGAGMGRSLGFPTANLETGYLVMPKPGIYATRVLMRNAQFQGVMYVGMRPTFPDREAHMACEVYILDFVGDVYQEWIRVQPVQHIRDDKKFASADELRTQIELDVRRAHTILDHA